MRGEGAASAACCIAAAKVEHSLSASSIQGNAHVEDGGICFVLKYHGGFALYLCGHMLTLAFLVQGDVAYGR